MQIFSRKTQHFAEFILQGAKKRRDSDVLSEPRGAMWRVRVYFSRMNTLMGVPLKSQCSRILFSR